MVKLNETMDTIGLIDSYYAKAKKYCQGWHDKIEHRRKLYNFQHYSSRPKQNEERYEDPTYTNVVDLGVGIILANDLEFQAYGWSPSQKEQEDSDQIEKYLGGVLQVNNEREEGLITYEVLMNFVRDGTGILYTVWDPLLADRYQTTFQVVDSDAGGPEESGEPQIKTVPGYYETPVRVQVVDPMEMFLIPGAPNRWSHVMRVMDVPVSDIEDEYGIVVRKYAHYSDYQKSEMRGRLIDYWCKKERAVMTVGADGVLRATGKVEVVILNALVFEGEVLIDMREMDGYDDLPFTIRFFKPVSKTKSAEWTHSIIDPTESSVAQLEKAMNRRMRQITTYSDLPMIAQVQTGRVLNIDPAYGNVVQMTPDEKMGFPQWPGSSPDVEMHIQHMQERASQSSFSDLMFGSGPTRMAGYAISMLVDQNRIRLNQPVHHLQELWTITAQKILKLTAHFGGDAVVRVYGRVHGADFNTQIFASDLAEYNVRCFIKPEFPDEKTRNHAMATQAAAFLSQDTIMERYLNIKQPGDERKRKLIEVAQNDPLVQRYSILKVLKEAAANDDDIAALVLQQAMSAPIQGAGQPGPQRNPEQPMGLAGASGMPPQQAAGGLPPGQSDIEQMQQMAGAAPQLLGGVR